MKKGVLMILLLLVFSSFTVVVNGADTFGIMDPIEVTAQLTGLDIRVTLAYDGVYSEAVLQPEQTLKTELSAKNTGSEEKSVQFILALYDKNKAMIGIACQDGLIGAGKTEDLSVQMKLPQDLQGCTAKVMVWDNYNSSLPYTHVTLTVENHDYFGDDYTLSQPLLSGSEAKGSISTLSDVDVFEFTAGNNGLYLFELYANADINIRLYQKTGATLKEMEAEVKSRQVGTQYESRSFATLQEGQKYYLYVQGKTVGNYDLKTFYAIGDVCGTVSPVQFQEGDDTFNQEIETVVYLTTLDTNQFVAAMHLSTSGLSDHASFSLTGIKEGGYLATISRPGYLALYTKVDLKNNVVDLGSKELIPGDLNGDGIINVQDQNLMNLAMNSSYGQSRYKVSADLNGDKVVNASDKELLEANINKGSNDYEEDLNVISASLSRDGNKLSILGRAKPWSSLTCDVYKKLGADLDQSLYVTTITIPVRSNGTFSALTESLFTNGEYIVKITAEDRAFDFIGTFEY